ncbi:hypothetical protein FDB15_18550 [Clostridium botulinum]|nr:hypothetical protein U728_1682 [Clostridium botulinum 202F]KON14100.1 hypothetical protein ACP50_04115 [Clostridium botulinum]NFH01807.1 hypothetical protein [Clostridium botulinum]NFH71562.1 hypothetical protein [Clostridium botulinum]NFI02729.1 hypothetical protein [Clostridium botulinum]
MKNNTFIKASLLIEIILTFFIPAKILSNPSIITYQYGYPFRYLNIYSKDNTNYQLINILFQGNDGIHIDIFLFIFNIIFIYLFISFISFIIHKINRT